MAAITIQQEVREYFSELSEDDQKQALELVKAFFANDEQSGSISIEQYNREIDEALAEVAQGNFIRKRKWKSNLRNGTKNSCVVAESNAYSLIPNITLKSSAVLNICIIPSLRNPP